MVEEIADGLEYMLEMLFSLVLSLILSLVLDRRTHHAPAHFDLLDCDEAESHAEVFWLDWPMNVAREALFVV